MYGTVLAGMETGDVVGMLPDREAATVEAWLKAHPGAAIICRDRAGAYAEGARDAAVLHAELRQQGWTGSARTVRRYIAPFRATQAAPEPPPAVPKTRQITKLLLTRPDHLDADEQEQLAGIRAQCPHLDAPARHVTAFAEMMTDRTGSTALDDWLAAV